MINKCTLPDMLTSVSGCIIATTRRPSSKRTRRLMRPSLRCDTDSWSFLNEGQWETSADSEEPFLESRISLQSTSKWAEIIKKGFFPVYNLNGEMGMHLSLRYTLTTAWDLLYLPKSIAMAVINLVTLLIDQIPCNNTESTLHKIKLAHYLLIVTAIYFTWNIINILGNILSRILTALMYLWETLTYVSGSWTWRPTTNVMRWSSDSSDKDTTHEPSFTKTSVLAMQTALISSSELSAYKAKSWARMAVKFLWMKCNFFRRYKIVSHNYTVKKKWVVTVA